MLAIVLSLFALVATLIGGAIVLRFQQLPRELLGFSAGTLMAIACLDLLPHSLQVCGPYALLGALAGYGALQLWHRLIHVGDHSHAPEALARAAKPTLIGAAALIVHKLFDGVILGVGVGGGEALGLGVGLAVIMHSFCDGINTVTLVLRARSKRVLAVGFLMANALAPLAAALLVARLPLSPLALGWLLTFVGGTFLYVALHDLLPAAVQSKTTLFAGADGVLSAAETLSLGSGLAAGVLLTWAITQLPG
ncbi:ZIP family metal transporter [Gloeobacter morelensis]|uniref:ZIP family metal transporter n=1 Tax=Gloeobacter morelensis MG652769 TaxID=2781736 RepID=A0ABY3PR40_9CYAN|nr:ZIP family metal transporter [Gloeobacter morelensis]UFP96176.1 ZIP family metal transporter [Gloeobacter morelensis MG652769]